MPEPIIEPITIAVELKRPRLWTSLLAEAGDSVASGLGVSVWFGFGVVTGKIFT
jgi:hypothetical protein